MAFTASIHLIIIIVSAILVWISGTRLALYSDWISHRSKLGRIFVGALLLAFATSLPEVATTITASWLGNAQLAINNLLGGIDLQTVIIAIVDLCLVSGALTYFTPKPALLISGIFVILQLAATLIAMTCGEVITFWNMGLWPFVLFCIYLGMLYFILRHEREERWVPTGSKPEMAMKLPTPSLEEFSNGRLVILFILNSLVVLAAGWSIAYYANLLAFDWNWSGSWMGATLVAFTTSLPEISTTFGAVRQKAYVLAIANIFGSNALTIAFLFPADFFYKKGPIMAEADSSNLFLAAVGVFLTSVFLWGILERRRRTFLRMGIDSTVVLLVYIFSLFLLYQIT